MTTTTTVPVTVRYFAAAAAAAGVETETLEITTGTTIAAMIERLGERNSDLARVLKRCSYLSDGVAVRDLERAVSTPQTLDVLPPFAGG